MLQRDELFSSNKTQIVQTNPGRSLKRITCFYHHLVDDNNVRVFPLKSIFSIIRSAVCSASRQKSSQRENAVRHFSCHFHFKNHFLYPHLTILGQPVNAKNDEMHFCSNTVLAAHRKSIGQVVNWPRTGEFDNVWPADDAFIRHRLRTPV